MAVLFPVKKAQGCCILMAFALLLMSTKNTNATKGNIGSSDQLLLFLDDTLFSTIDPRLSLRMEPPTKGPWAVTPTEPWESWAVFGYNSVVAGDGERPHRLYYDCIEGDGVPPGRNMLGSSGISHRRICLATSEDGVTWIKPILNIFNWNGSTANNILIEDSGNSVFIDKSAAAPDSQRWKMVCSTSAYASSDGLKWNKLPFSPVAEDDTKPTALWDPTMEKYVIMVRRDLPGSGRNIGRCITNNISDWQQASPGGCPTVFGPDELDPSMVDVYTNAWTPYPSIDSPVVHLFFPSFYHHFQQPNPYGFGNDGILDIRLVITRNLSANLTYTTATNARSPFVPLGINNCGGTAHAPETPDGWCSPTSGEEAQTSADTSAMYMASGHIMSSVGDEVFFYASGQPFTHGGDSGKHLWGNNTGIRVLRSRRDGFVAVEAPYVFNANMSTMPSFTTVDLQVPTTCPPPVTNHTHNLPKKTGCGYEFPNGVCPPNEPVLKCNTTADCIAADPPSGGTCHGVTVSCREGGCSTGKPGGDLCYQPPNGNGTTVSGGVVLKANHVTGVVGFVAIQVQDCEGTPLPGFTTADLLRGNSLDSVASWNEGTTASLSSLSGSCVRFQVTMADAKLYSLTLGCASPQ
eukprot:m.179576 g.179576  ORF g.179576 m.179576 type:complete len:633 (-) comp31981_c0_seq2:690-2588(-)